MFSMKSIVLRAGGAKRKSKLYETCQHLTTVVLADELLGGM